MPCSSKKNSYLCTHVGKRMNFYKTIKRTGAESLTFCLFFGFFSLFFVCYKKMINFANVSFIK